MIQAKQKAARSNSSRYNNSNLNTLKKLPSTSTIPVYLRNSGLEKIKAEAL